MGLINLGETIVALRTEVDRFRKQRDQYKAERDTLIDDIAVLSIYIRISFCFLANVVG